MEQIVKFSCCSLFVWHAVFTLPLCCRGGPRRFFLNWSVSLDRAILVHSWILIYAPRFKVHDSQRSDTTHARIPSGIPLKSWNEKRWDLWLLRCEANFSRTLLTCKAHWHPFLSFLAFSWVVFNTFTNRGWNLGCQSKEESTASVDTTATFWLLVVMFFKMRVQSCVLFNANTMPNRNIWWHWNSTLILKLHLVVDRIWVFTSENHTNTPNSDTFMYQIVQVIQVDIKIRIYIREISSHRQDFLSACYLQPCATQPRKLQTNDCSSWPSAQGVSLLQNA